jgi:Tfp pilus assembly protein PilO
MISSSSSPIKKQLNDFLITYFRALSLIILLATLAVGVFFVIYPKYRAIKSKTDSVLSDQSQKIEFQQQYIAILKQANTNFAKVNEEDLRRLNEFLPDKADTEKLLIQLEQYEKDSGMQFNSFSINESTEGQAENMLNNNSATDSMSHVGRIKISLSVAKLNYTQIKQFLDKLQTNLRLLDIVNVSFGSGSGGVVLDMYTYYKK